MFDETASFIVLDVLRHIVYELKKTFEQRFMTITLIIGGKNRDTDINGSLIARWALQSFEPKTYLDKLDQKHSSTFVENLKVHLLIFCYYIV